MVRAFFETLHIQLSTLNYLVFLLFCFESYDAPNLFSCVLTTEEEAAASKRLVLLNFNFSADRTKFQAIA